jgi:radical SAM protein with 4Fe4S-binding SPASM domain
LNETRKFNCQLNNSIHVHNNGNIYICHGCAYKDNNLNLCIGNTSNISSFFDVLTSTYHYNSLPQECINCNATYCSICHITHLEPTQDPYKHWLDCRVNNINRCKYFKIFGFISKLLRYLTLKYNYQ